MGLHRHLPLLLLMLALLGPQAAAAPRPQAVHDLAYGEVLFDFFQEDYFSAITRLQAALQGRRLPHHREEAELLEGGLLLSYGLHNEAERVFTRLLDQNDDPALRNQAWFHLARIWQRRGYAGKAAAALDKVHEQALPLELRDEAHLLRSRVLMDLGDYAAAARLLAAPTRSHLWAAYARFNLGVALVRNGQRAEGLGLLAEVGALQTQDEELLALRDKANLALGYIHLRDKEAVDAAQCLQQVRLQGLSAAPALLGLGWAEFAVGRLSRALVPWDELSRRSVTEPAVQEALLAIPYALVEASAYGQAAQRYQQAVDALVAERQRIHTLGKEVRKQGIAELLLRQDEDKSRGWLWQLRNPPAETQNRELLHLLAGNEFQAVLRNYRELRFLARDLDRWQRNTGAFQDMLTLRRLGYQQRLPRIEAGYRRLDPEAARRQRDSYAARLRDIAAREDAPALATAGELRLQAGLEKVANLLQRHGKKDALNPQREKLHLLQGVYRWRLAQDYKPRLWTLRKHLKALDTALAEADERRLSLARARHQAPQGFAGYDQRIATLQTRLGDLQTRVTAARERHEAYLRTLVLRTLAQREERLRAYEVQARFGLARIYDLAADKKATQP